MVCCHKSTFFGSDVHADALLEGDAGMGCAPDGLGAMAGSEGAGVGVGAVGCRDT